jgi:hypothetical protein
MLACAIGSSPLAWHKRKRGEPVLQSYFLPAVGTDQQVQNINHVARMPTPTCPFALTVLDENSDLYVDRPFSPAAAL